MFRHPILDTLPGRQLAGLILLAASGVVWGLTVLYGEVEAGPALGIGISYVVFLSLAVLLYGVMVRFLPMRTLRMLLAFAALLAALSLTWGTAELCEWCSWKTYIRLVPLLALYGSMGWKILALWFGRPPKEETALLTEEPVEEPDGERPEILDRISVKKGSEIHILKVEELRYIQADGDYVTLFTDSGKFLKEQTMKYFETRLPDNFVRIHRSCIVNVDQITRVELFGKESYHVRIKNGVVLKASVPGYKLLKARLDL